MACISVKNKIISRSMLVGNPFNVPAIPVDFLVIAGGGGGGTSRCGKGGGGGAGGLRSTVTNTGGGGTLPHIRAFYWNYLHSHSWCWRCWIYC
jgi:hypothetical protein